VKDRFDELGFDTNSLNIAKGIVNNDIIVPQRYFKETYIQ
jgi:hypothetical protein